MVFIAACNGSPKIALTSNSVSTSISGFQNIAALEPSVGRSGDSILIKGENLTPGVILSINNIQIDHESTAQGLRFMIPEGIVGLNLLSIVMQDGTTALPIIVLPTNRNFSLLNAEPSVICNDQQFYSLAGMKVKGERTCTTPINVCPADTTPPVIIAGDSITTNKPIVKTIQVIDRRPTTVKWELLEGPADPSPIFTVLKSNEARIAPTKDGLYRFRVTAQDSSDNTASDQFILHYDTTPPSLDAPADLTHFTSIGLKAVASDTSSLLYKWSLLSGPGPLTFDSPESLETVATPSIEGTYEIQIQALDAAGNSATDIVLFTYLKKPIVSLGPDVVAKNPALITAEISNANVPSFSWTQISGPGSIVFVIDPSQNKIATVQATLDGTYQIGLTVTNSGGESSSASMTFTWDTTPPIVTVPATFVAKDPQLIVASVTDMTAVTYAWERFSGPGNLIFTDTDKPSTTVTADTDGTYFIKLTVKDVPGNTTVKNLSYTRDTTPPVVGVGPDISIAGLYSLNPVVDGTAVTFLWSRVSGTGSVTFGSPTSQNSTVLLDTHGDHIIRLTVTDALGNSAFDELTIRWTPFSSGWDFTIETQYTFNPAQTSMSKGHATLLPLDFSDAEDKEENDFSLGAFGNTQWQTDALKLTTAGAAAFIGTFNSRVFDVGAPANIEAFTWTIDRPYQKNLPDNNGKEATFDAGNMDMNGNVLLMHFDEAPGSAVAYDTSGNGHIATCTSCPTTGVEGKLGLAHSYVNHSFRIPHKANLLFPNNFTISSWIYSSLSNAVILEKGRDEVKDAYAMYIWNGKLALEFKDQVDTQRYFLSSGNVPINTWSHVAVSFDEINDKMYFYINGRLDTTITTDRKPLMDFGVENQDIYIGRQNALMPYYFSGKIDEVALFNRALSQTEVIKMYQRGAMRLSFQVRGCTQADCSDAAVFKGPNSSTTNRYDSSSGLGASGKGALAHISAMRYFQYNARLETYNATGHPSTATISPALKSVSFIKFAGTGPSIITNTGISYQRLSKFTENTLPNHSGSVLYQLSPDGTTFYQYTGSSWTLAANSPTSPAGNTAKKVNDHISEFSTNIGSGTLYLRMYLLAPLGVETIALDRVTIEGRD